MKIRIDRPSAPSAQLNVVIVPFSGNSAKSKSTVFILPGGPGADLQAYQKYACLQAVGDVVFHDPRGCGESSKGEISACNMQNYIDDVEALRQHLALDKVVVIGKSYGAMCALGYALRYPHAVQKLILSAGAPSYHFLEKAKNNLQRMGTLEQIAIAKKLWAGSFANREELLQYFSVTNNLYSIKAQAQPALFNLEQKAKQFAYDVLNEGFKNKFWHFDYEEDLYRIACPTLIAAGRQDWITDMEWSKMMAARIPRSQLQIFENASHALETDVPDVYFAALADFIRQG